MATAATLFKKKSGVQPFDVSSLVSNDIDVRSQALHDDRVNLFASLLKSNITLPPIKVYRRENCVCVLDGRHRLEAARKLGKKTIKGIEVPYTNRVDMMVRALQDNMTADGAPLAPSMDDFYAVLQKLSKAGLSRADCVQKFVGIGIPEVFAKQTVQTAFHNIDQFNILHAYDAVRLGRMTAPQAATHYGVSPARLKSRLDKNGGPTVEKLALDLAARIKALKKMTAVHLKGLADTGGMHLASDAIRTAVRPKWDEFQRWVDAQEPIYR